MLEQLLSGQLSIDTTVQALKAALTVADESNSTVSNTDDACVDVGREARCGFPEVVFGEGKTADAIVSVFRKLAQHNQSCLATRIDTEQAQAVLAEFPNAIHNEIARTVRLQITDFGSNKVQEADNKTQPGAESGQVVVVSAGTSDRPVAEEALETLAWMGIKTDFVYDIGVAGPQRLQQQVHRLEQARAIVVCAGMEGALASVVGGYVACPVFAVPTSVGYGANFGGLAALLAMLNSCAANVAVVNIDAGFKAAYLAGLVAHVQR
jgi:NCAIR mutase (PurE)-related protein